MTKFLSQFTHNAYPYFLPDFEEDDDVTIEEGFIETEEDQEDEEIEWLWEEEFETEVDGPIGPGIIKKGRYTETL